MPNPSLRKTHIQHSIFFKKNLINDSIGKIFCSTLFLLSISCKIIGMIPSDHLENSIIKPNEIIGYRDNIFVNQGELKIIGYARLLHKFNDEKKNKLLLSTSGSIDSLYLIGIPYAYPLKELSTNCELFSKIEFNINKNINNLLIQYPNAIDLRHKNRLIKFFPNVNSTSPNNMHQNVAYSRLFNSEGFLTDSTEPFFDVNTYGWSVWKFLHHCGNVQLIDIIYHQSLCWNNDASKKEAAFIQKSYNALKACILAKKKAGALPIMTPSAPKQPTSTYTKHSALSLDFNLLLKIDDNHKITLYGTRSDNDLEQLPKIYAAFILYNQHDEKNNIINAIAGQNTLFANLVINEMHCLLRQLYAQKDTVSYRPCLENLTQFSEKFRCIDNELFSRICCVTLQLITCRDLMPCADEESFLIYRNLVSKLGTDQIRKIADLQLAPSQQIIFDGLEQKHRKFAYKKMYLLFKILKNRKTNLFAKLPEDIIKLLAHENFD